MQCAIDNAKRKFDIDIMEEILLIKQSMNISLRGYPQFWGVIRPDFNKNNINEHLKCPMNYIYNISLPSYTPEEDNIPISKFFIKHRLDGYFKTSRNIEKLIEKYSLKQTANSFQHSTDHYLYLMKQKEFDQLIEDIRQTNISKKYVAIMSWLIDRAFYISPEIKSNAKTILSKTKKNRSVLLKVLFNVNSSVFLQCFLQK